MVRSFRRVSEVDAWLDITADERCKSCAGCGRTGPHQLDRNFLKAADLSGQPEVITIRSLEGRLFPVILQSLGLPLLGMVTAVALTASLQIAELLQALSGFMGLAAGIWLAQWLPPINLKDTFEISANEQD